MSILNTDPAKREVGGWTWPQKYIAIFLCLGTVLLLISFYVSYHRDKEELHAWLVMYKYDGFLKDFLGNKGTQFSFCYVMSWFQLKLLSFILNLDLIF